MATRRPRVAFVRMGPHPIPNRLLPEALASVLPGHEVEVLDVEAAVRAEWRTWIANAPFLALQQGRALARGKTRPWRAFFTTTYAFRHMSRRAREWVAAGDFDWSLQIQSLFDARTPGVPHFVYTDHTHLANLAYPDFDPRDLHSPRWIALERALYLGASTVFTRSAHVSRSLVEAYGCEPARVSRVGAGANALIPSSEATRAPAKEILFVGVDWERKGGPELLEAFRRVRALHPEARLTIVGCTPPGAERAAGEGWRALGRRPVEEIHRYYADADVFCLPTRREPFGVAFVEALHHGLPIVGTRIGAVPDLVEDGGNGLLVDVGDVEALAASLARLLDEPALRRRMGAAARRRAREGYTWPVVAARICAGVEGQLATLAPTPAPRDAPTPPDPGPLRDAVAHR